MQVTKNEPSGKIIPPFALTYGQEGTAETAKLYVGDSQVCELFKISGGPWQGTIGAHTVRDNNPANVATALIAHLA